VSRVIIRPPMATDQAAFIEAMQRSRELHGRWIEMPSTPEQYAVYLRRAADPSVERFLACRAEDGAIVGFLNLSEIIRGKLQQAFLGYGGVAGFERRGYMSEAMQLVLEHAFTVLGLHRIEANIQPGNEASIALARRAGFEREGFSPSYLMVDGRWRDHERWAIREETWLTSRRS
jgi:ribosomal-protein-alanine N-acetyltransferase